MDLNPLEVAPAHGGIRNDPRFENLTLSTVSPQQLILSILRNYVHVISSAALLKPLDVDKSDRRGESVLAKVQRQFSLGG